MLRHFQSYLYNLFGAVLSYYQSLSIDTFCFWLLFVYTLFDICLYSFWHLPSVGLNLICLLAILFYCTQHNILLYLIKVHFSISALSTWLLHNSKLLSLPIYKELIGVSVLFILVSKSINLFSTNNTVTLTFYIHTVPVLLSTLLTPYVYMK